MVPTEPGSVGSGESIPGLTRLAGMCRAQGRLPEAERYLRQALIRLEASRQDHPGLAEVLQKLAEIQAEQGEFVKAEALLQRACERLREGSRPLHLARALRSWAEICCRQNQTDRARQMLEEALAICPPDASDETAYCRLRLAAMHATQGEYQKAWDLAAPALQAGVRGHWPPATRLAVLRQMAWLCELLDLGREAEQYWRLLLESFPAQAGGGEIAKEAIHCLLRSYEEQGRHDEALALARQAVPAQTGREAPHPLQSLTELLHLALRAGRYIEAGDLLRRIWLQLEKSARQSENPENPLPTPGLFMRIAAGARELAGQQSALEAAGTLQTLLRWHEIEPCDALDHARTLDQLGLRALEIEAPGYREAAGRWLAQALALRQKHLAEPHEEIALTLFHVGTWQERKQDWAAALETYQRGLTMLDALSATTVWYLPWLDCMARLAAAFNQPELSESCQIRALALALERNESHSPEILRRRLCLGEIREKLGRWSDAESVYREALAEEESPLPEWRAILLRMAGLLYRQSRFSDAIPLYGRCLAWLRQHDEKNPGEQLMPLERLGEIAWREGQYQQAEDWLQQALYLRQKHPAGDAQGLALVQLRLAESQDAQGKLAEAIASARQAIDLDTEQRLDAATEAAAHELLARGALRQGQRKAALTHYRQALRAREDAGEFIPLARILEASSEMQARAQYPEEAALLQQRALHFWQIALPPDHPRLGQAWWDWARRLRLLGQMNECRRAMQTALGTLTTAWGADDWRLAPVWREQAELLAESDDAANLEIASQCCKQAIKLTGRAPDREAVPTATEARDVTQARLWLLKAAIARRLGQNEPAEESLRRAQAACAGIWWSGAEVAGQDEVLENPGGEQSEAVFRNALTIWEKALGLDHPHVAASLFNLAQVCAGQGKLDEAEQLFLRALDIQRRLLGPNHRQVAETCNQLGGVCQKLGRMEEAENWCRQAVEIWERSQEK